MNFFPGPFFTGFSPLVNGLLNGAAWSLLVAIPLAIIALYFLKLRRQPLEVPSTFLWRRAIEDLHVNSLWQRLRKNWLLFLQLLLILLIILALLQPGWRGTKLTGDRFIFLIDASASMSAMDVQPTRLESAKKQALEALEQLEEEHVAMIVSFSDVARIEQSFTDNKGLLRRKLAGIQPTNRPSDMHEALRAASGLANPGRTSERGSSDVQVAEALPAELLIFSDGGFASVRDFHLGNLRPKYVPVASETPANLGIVAFTTEQNPEKPGELQAFGRIQNSGPADVTVNAELYINDVFSDVKEVKVPAGEDAGVDFELSAVALADQPKREIKLSLDHKDDLPLDNVAYAAVNAPRKARVLLVTERNDALTLALQTEEALEISETTMVSPAALADKPENKKLLDDCATGAFDLVIYDQCSPREMPAANTLFFAAIPPAPPVAPSVNPEPTATAPPAAPASDTDPAVLGWSASVRQGPPIIIDIDRVHPLMQLIDMSNVNIIEGIALKPPQGGISLIDADIGSLMAIAPRAGFEDAVLGFELVTNGEGGQREVNSDWSIRRSFPVFVMNVVKYLGGSRGAMANVSARPGSAVVLRASAPLPKIYVRSPEGRRSELLREGRGEYIYNDTDRLGVYDVFESSAQDDKNIAQQFAVNLFDARETDISRVSLLDLTEGEPVEGRPAVLSTRKEGWKWLLLGGLVVLLGEWGMYLYRMYR